MCKWLHHFHSYCVCYRIASRLLCAANEAALNTLYSYLAYLSIETSRAQHNRMEPYSEKNERPPFNWYEKVQWIIQNRFNLYSAILIISTSFMTIGFEKRFFSFFFLFLSHFLARNMNRGKTLAAIWLTTMPISISAVNSTVDWSIII